MSLDGCYPSPCFNGGTCVATNNESQASFQCLCGALYVGVFCETKQKVIIVITSCIQVKILQGCFTVFVQCT